MPEREKSRSVRGLVVHQDARYARDLELRIAYDFYSLALTGYK